MVPLACIRRPLDKSAKQSVTGKAVHQSARPVAHFGDHEPDSADAARKRREMAISSRPFITGLTATAG